jgi:hypothetical protein
MKFVSALSSPALATTLQIAEKPLPRGPQSSAQPDQHGQRGNIASRFHLLEVPGRDAQRFGEKFLAPAPEFPQASDVMAETLGVNGQRSRFRFRLCFYSNSADG